MLDVTPLIKFFIALGLIIFLMVIGLAAIGAGIRYFYTKRILNIGKMFIRFGVGNKPMQMYELLTETAKKTTSFQEVVFLCSRMHVNLPKNPWISWSRTHRIGREGILETTLLGKDHRHHRLTIHLKRKHQRWKVANFQFIEDHSLPITLETTR